ncbi:MAG: hypothetical protein GQ546_06350 [Gammaproteobacteria bacterium]|nr:hypothetical protein [Gammaproteobacteria bacterium]
MLGLDYKVIPSPGKKDSQANEEYFVKYRKLFKTNGILAIFYVILQSISISLE